MSCYPHVGLKSHKKETMSRHDHINIVSGRLNNKSNKEKKLYPICIPLCTTTNQTDLFCFRPNPV